MQKFDLERYEKMLTETALPWLMETDDVNWSLHCGSDTFKGVVYKGHVPKYGTIWKAQIVMDCSAEAAFNSIIRDGDFSWMPNLGLVHVLEGTDDWTVFYQIAKGQSGISDRDFYTIRFNRKTEGCNYSIGCSLDRVPAYDYEPPSKKIVRGENLPAGFAWKQTDNPNQCIWTYIYNVDLKGYLPRSLVNFVVPSFLQQMAVCIGNFSKSIPDSAKENEEAVPEKARHHRHHHKHHHHHHHHHGHQNQVVKVAQR